MDPISEGSALDTLTSLADRLKRLEWYLNGSSAVRKPLEQVTSEGRDNAVQSRLGRLERDLHILSSKSAVVNNLLRLHATYPDLFQPSTSGIPTTLSPAELLSIINSCATSYQKTASRLSSIKDVPIPSAQSSSSLILLQPRLGKVGLMQDIQAQEMSELRTRSAAAIQRWYELGVLGGSECWTEWEGRIVDAEKQVRREEMHQAQDAKEQEAYQA